MIELTIDGQKVCVKKGTSVHQAAKQLQINVPIFCYHDRMPPFGACRICLVEVKGKPNLQASCTLEAQAGMVVETQSQTAKEGRNQIMELLLINHPLDCPICDRGGECPLQEHALHHGPGISRFFEEKRRFKKPVPRGPVLMLDRERCIACARCTRFGELIAGDNALELVHRGFHTEVGTPGDGPARSKFIGNTIMICPVGALTSQVYRFRARPWDNAHKPTTCTLCPIGCSMEIDSRDGEVMRTRARENKKVNDIWLCDKGWFGYEFTAHPDRLQTPWIRRGGILREASWEEAFTLIASRIETMRPAQKLAALGGAALSIEENYLLQKLMREVIGVPHVDYRIGQPVFSLEKEGVSAGMETPLQEVEDLSFIVLFGLDVTEEYPVLWLRLHQAIHKGAKVLFFGHFSPEMAKHLSEVIVHAPGQEVATLQRYEKQLLDLAKTGKSAFFIGRQYLHSSDRTSILSQLLKIRHQDPHIQFNILDAWQNSLGARYAGMHPELLPEEELAVTKGLDAQAIFETARLKGWDFLYIVSSNPARQLSQAAWQEVRKRTHFIVVQDLFLTETAKEADVVLPALAFLEKEGTFLNIEHSLLPIHTAKNVPEGLYNDGEIFTEIAHRLGSNLHLNPAFFSSLRQEKTPFSIPKQLPSVPQKNNGDLRASFAPALFDHGTRMRHNPHLSQLVDEADARIHPKEAEKRGLQDKEETLVESAQGSIRIKIRLDRTVAEETIVLPIGFSTIPLQELDAPLLNGLPIKIGKAPC